MSQSNINFRLRGLWFGLVFWAGFSLYSFDHRNVIDAISHFANQHWGWSADASARGDVSGRRGRGQQQKEVGCELVTVR